MSKRTVFTTISPLPAGISRETVLDFLKDHVEMIDLNPLIKERHPIKPPADAEPEELHCKWYSLTDKITYLPGGLATGDISYTAAFYDLPNGIQTHCRAPLGVDIRAKWSLNGTLPGEPLEPVELGIGAPQTGLYIREDVDLRCNVLMASFVKKNLKKSHLVLIDRLVHKARAISMSGAGDQPDRLSAEKPPARSWSPARPPPSQPLGWPPATQDSSATPARRTSPPRYPSAHAPAGRYPNPHQTDMSNQLHLYHANSQDSVVSQRQQQQLGHGHEQYSSAPQSSHSSTAPPYTVPVAGGRDTSLYPNPLRLRNSSTSSAGSQRDNSGQPSWNQHGSMSSNHSRSASTHSQQHADYPEMNPYSGGAGAEDSPQDVEKPPVFIAELSGHDPRDVIYRAGFRPDEKVDHPVSLRPGNRMTATLNGPFIAELE